MPPNLSIPTSALVRRARVVLALRQHFREKLLRPHDPGLGHGPIRKVYQFGFGQDFVGVPFFLRISEETFVILGTEFACEKAVLAMGEHHG